MQKKIFNFTTKPTYLATLLLNLIKLSNERNLKCFLKLIFFRVTSEVLYINSKKRLFRRKAYSLIRVRTWPPFKKVGKLSNQWQQLAA